MKKLLTLILILFFTGCSTAGNRTSTFTYDPISYIATFNGRTNEKFTATLPNGTILEWDRQGGEGILAKILGIMTIMPRMSVGTD